MEGSESFLNTLYRYFPMQVEPISQKCCNYIYKKIYQTCSSLFEEKETAPALIIYISGSSPQLGTAASGVRPCSIFRSQKAIMFSSCHKRFLSSYIYCCQEPEVLGIPKCHHIVGLSKQKPQIHQAVGCKSSRVVLGV